MVLALALGAAPVLADDLDEPLGDSAPSGLACPAMPLEFALDDELGSVGFMKNVAEHPESIRAIAVRLLNKAVASDAFKTAPSCEHDCVAAPRTEIVYKVEPTVFLAEPEQDAMCLQMEEATAARPMHFGKKTFASVEKLNDWVMEFSQGRGEDGKQLYTQCGGNCSPRYTFFIERSAEALTISADVLCGLARNKKNDQYLVSTAVRWRCPD